jgi:hypothetical protein
MPIDRREITRLEELNPVERHYAADRGERSPGAEGSAVARMGYEVLDRAEPRSAFDTSRRGLTPPVHEEPNADRDQRVPAVVKY